MSVPGAPGPDPTAATVPACYRHPDRRSAVRCTRCEKPICTDCMVEAPVGWQCPECTRAGAKRSRQVPAFTRTGPGRSGVVGSTNPTPVVLVIVAINAVVFLLEGFGTNDSVIARYAMSPAAISLHQQYYRAFTSMFLHANFQHIIFNMIALLIVGPAVEVLLGKARFVALYLIAGFGGSVASYLLSTPRELGVGASGAIMGVMGAYVVIGLRRRLPVTPVVLLLAVNFAIGFWGNIDWRAHFGGLVTGALLALVYDYAGGLRDHKADVALTVGVSAVVVAVLALVLTGVAPGHVNLS